MTMPRSVGFKWGCFPGGMLLLAALATSFIGKVDAATYTWISTYAGAAGANWNLTTNWSGGVLPTAADSIQGPTGTDSATFTGGGSSYAALNLNGSSSWNLLTVATNPATTFNLGGITWSGGTLTFEGKATDSYGTSSSAAGALNLNFTTDSVE